MTKQELKKLSVRELMHYWLNRKIDVDYSRRSYRFTPDKFYCKGVLYGIFKDDILYFNEKFDNTGSYSNGLGFWQHVNHSIPSHIDRVIYCTKLPDKLHRETSEQEDIQFIIDEFICRNKNTINVIASGKHIASNNRMFEFYGEVLNYDFVIPDLGIFTKDVVDKVLNKPFEINPIFKYYTSWNRYEYRNSMNITVTINQLVSGIKQFFTDEELNILELKNFYGEIKDYKRCSFKELKKKWFSKDKDEFTNSIITAINSIKDKRDKARRKKEESNIKLSLKNIDKFRAGANNPMIYHLPFTVFKMIDNDTAQSSLGMRLTLDEIKKGIDLFNTKSTNTNETIKGFNYKGIQVKDIPYLDEEDNVQYKQESCIVVGCHIVPESEINNFVNYYKL